MTIRRVPGLYHGDGGRLQESIDNKILKLGFKRVDEDGGIAPNDLDDVALFEVLSVPHRFLPDSGDSSGIRCIPEECKLAEGSANSAIPGIPHSSGIYAFRNCYRNVPRNSPERNATGMHLPECSLICN